MGKWLNGARVRENGEAYVCTRDIDPLLYPPSQVTAHFTKRGVKPLLLGMGV